jgi:hypothetical protein
MSPLSVPKIFMAGGAVGFGYYLYMRQYWFPNPYKTQGVQNIEDRFSAGGGSPTHTPAVASHRGNGDNLQEYPALTGIHQVRASTTRGEKRAATTRARTPSTSRATFQTSRAR